MSQERIDGRKADEMREVRIIPGVNPYAEGSAEVSFGNTKLLVTASVENRTPPWMEPGQGGWITAEYGMLPRSTHTRSRREASAGGQSGRTQEIQRLIGRALRQATSLERLGELTIRLDCDVICADGGTRTAAISGAWVALHHAIRWAKDNNLSDPSVEVLPVAAVSVGVVDGKQFLDLCYEEDATAEFDMNLVFTAAGDLIEIQGTAERQTLSKEGLSELLLLGEKGAELIFNEQKKALSH